MVHERDTLAGTRRSRWLLLVLMVVLLLLLMMALLARGGPVPAAVGSTTEDTRRSDRRIRCPEDVLQQRCLLVALLHRQRKHVRGG
uniref:Putative secreted protein n=1 Tax=Anopheles darlingi TaxID=43151 RepID=A0A2M4D092_ANODA